MAEYKVTGLMADEPKVWHGPHGDVWYHDVNVEGHDKLISVGKKEKNSIKVGDILYGDITETDYLADKFKASPPPQSDFKKSEWKPKDERQITRNMVWKNLLQHYDIPTMVPDSKQWQEFWGFVDLHTDMLLPKNVTETAKKEFNKEPLPPEPVGENDYVG